MAWPWVVLLLLLLLHLIGRPFFLEGLAADRELNLSVALSGAAASLLGLVVATLAILVAFPAKPTARLLRTFAGWSILQYSLLLTALDLLALLIASLTGIVSGHYFVTDAIAAFTSGATIGLVICGLLFGLILLNLAKGQDADP